MQKKNKNQKGLSLMETIINIYVYSVVILVCMTVSIAYIRSRIAVRQTQQAVEELALTMNEMSKKIRMSSCGSPCVEEKRIEVVPNVNSGAATYLVYEIDTDGNRLVDGADNLIMEDIGGKFEITNNGSDQIPLIKIKFWRTKKGTGTKIPGTDIQTSVSMRTGYN